MPVNPVTEKKKTISPTATKMGIYKRKEKEREYKIDVDISLPSNAACTLLFKFMV
jgi:hypothetical protein